jgi:hypothetical protein
VFVFVLLFVFVVLFVDCCLFFGALYPSLFLPNQQADRHAESSTTSTPKKTQIQRSVSSFLTPDSNFRPKKQRKVPYKNPKYAVLTALTLLWADFLISLLRSTITPFLIHTQFHRFVNSHVRSDTSARSTEQLTTEANVHTHKPAPNTQHTMGRNETLYTTGAVENQQA